MSDDDHRSGRKRGLPLRGARKPHKRPIIAHHLILHGYGHWFPNDPRGSGSDEVRQEKLVDLGPIHKGRKAVQPSRAELKRFMNEGQPRLQFEPIWYDDAKRQAIGGAFEQVVNEIGYMVWACAVLTNHAHLCVRRHRDDAQAIWKRLAHQSREAIRRFSDVPDGHPVWSLRPYARFLHTPDEVWSVIKYIEQNPVKEGLARQIWPFVQPYNNWPFHKKPS